MSGRATLLIELGTEELPPRALLKLSQSFAAGFESALKSADFPFGTVTAYATPRRLALSISEVGPEQPDRREQRRGPALAAAFDASGAPTKAAAGFARSCGVEPAALGRLKTAEGEWLVFEQRVPGRPLADVLAAMVETALAGLPIPKRMRWGARSAEFVRPVHWLVMLHGADIVPGVVLGLTAGRVTRGHRFHHPEPIVIPTADSYTALLAEPGHVIAAFDDRRTRVRTLAETLAATTGEQAVIDDALLDEVTALVEWPVPIAGTFDAHFLELPPEVLIATMQDHQKYFPVCGADGHLTNRFITMSNLDSRDPEQVRRGNERVIRPRLSDADFFYRSDRRQPLEAQYTRLAGMLFEKRLGSLQDKTARTEVLARQLAPAFGADVEGSVRAAHLARCDLLTAMVGEFPELQGTMGRYYALADGESTAVATAVGEFYRPRFAGDDIPASALGRCVAVCDKLDTLIGIFGIGSVPTGDRDPFALRRAAIGVLRILIEGEVELDLVEALEAAAATHADNALDSGAAALVLTFMRERMRGYYLDRGIPADVCAAVFAAEPGAPLDVDRRLAAVQRFRALDAAVALAAANKRISNILRKVDGELSQQVDPALLVEPAERALHASVAALAPLAAADFEAREYGAYLARLAPLRVPVDAFFDAVMVMAEDSQLRANRLALLAQLHSLFTRVADIGRLHEH